MGHSKRSQIKVINFDSDPSVYVCFNNSRAALMALGRNGTVENQIDESRSQEVPPPSRRSHSIPPRPFGYTKNRMRSSSAAGLGQSVAHGGHGMEPPPVEEGGAGAAGVAGKPFFRQRQNPSKTALRVTVWTKNSEVP